jgi:hypothetical protein
VDLQRFIPGLKAGYVFSVLILIKVGRDEKPYTACITSPFTHSCTY